jgi:TolB-like protein/DNA-binding winged helix-turn-helix (wHTH) protein
MDAGSKIAEPPGSVVITFGVFHLDAKKGQLKRFGTALRLSSQPFRLLVLLASRHGEVVTREEIQQALWGPDTFVDFERGLNHCIRQIRAVLGDDAGAPSYIETIPRIGYRFVAPVSMAPPDPTGAVSSPVPPDEDRQPASGRAAEIGVANGRRRWFVLSAAIATLALATLFLSLHPWREARPEQPPLRLMVAVLPFENLTGDPDRDYLSDGVTDELIVHLGGVSPSRLGVIARTSAMNYKHSGKLLAQIGRELGVKYLLEGTVKSSGETIRITAQLVRSDDQTELWADTYDGEVNAERILAFQQSVAGRIAQSLSLVLPEVHTPHSTTTSQAAYEAFLKGRLEWNKRNENGFLKSIGYFKSAVTLDPAYAEAWAGLADSYNLSREYYEGRSSSAMAESGKDAAFRALTLDPKPLRGPRIASFQSLALRVDVSRSGVGIPQGSGPQPQRCHSAPLVWDVSGLARALRRSAQRVAEGADTRSAVAYRHYKQRLGELLCPRLRCRYSLLSGGPQTGQRIPDRPDEAGVGLRAEGHVAEGPRRETQLLPYSRTS